MKAFAALYDALDRQNGTNAKVAVLKDWFGRTPPADAAWAVAFLCGRRPKRLLGVRLLAGWACERADIPGWLFEECYAVVGDLAETLCLLLEPHTGGAPEEELPLHRWVQERILPLREADREAQVERLGAWLLELRGRERFLFVKVLTGAFRVGVSQLLVARALAELAGLPRATVAARLTGRWEPSGAFFEELLAPEDAGTAPCGPFPCFLASPLEGAPEELGPRDDWLAEWKWDGIRAQLLFRDGEVELWSRGDELLTARFPSLVAAAAELPERCVLDGELLGWRDGAPLPFSALQTRINRKQLTKKVLAACPVVFMAFDLLELAGEDWRARPLHERRARLGALLEGRPLFPLSAEVEADSWAGLARLREGSRERGVEGLLLKRRSSPYRTGRRKGDWWKWKVAPLSVDAVMIYAQKGSGRRASRYTDYTFGVWRDGALVTVAKAYSGLSNGEIDELDRWVRRHTKERFGPVAVVEPEQVFELHFDSLRRSKRHKAGLALRFPRIARWRKDKTAEEADTLGAVASLLPPEES